jgi:glycerophosphoryl diester phosphodiesterase
MTTIFDDSFKIIVYRGGAELFPENSIEAIDNSIKENSSVVIEIDLQITKDKEIIAFHDFHLDDLTNGIGLVKDFQLLDLQKLFLKNPDKSTSTCKIVTLENIFDEFPNQCFVLDLHENNKALFEKVIEIVERKGRQRQIALVSIANGVTRELKKLRPNWIFVASPQETKKFIFANKIHLQKFIKITSQIIFLPDKLGKLSILNESTIRELHRRNIKVWTCKNFKPYQNVNRLTDLKNYQKMNVDGIYTDNPKHLK